MLEEILGHLNNWFVVPGGVHEGTYTIEEGQLVLPFLTTGQYFRICGSVFNDGLYQYPASSLTDEVFEGTVWAMAVPPAVMDLQTEIKEWVDKYGEVNDSPYQSESFGGYSYTKMVAGSSESSIGWQTQFRSKLNRWRRIRP
jgi:hypothetical protein